MPQSVTVCVAGSDLGGRDRRQQLAGVHVLSQVEGDKATVTGIQCLLWWEPLLVPAETVAGKRQQLTGAHMLTQVGEG